MGQLVTAPTRTMAAGPAPHKDSRCLSCRFLTRGRFSGVGQSTLDGSLLGANRLACQQRRRRARPSDGQSRRAREDLSEADERGGIVARSVRRRRGQ